MTSKCWYFEVTYLGPIVGAAQGYGLTRVSKHEKAFQLRGAHRAALKGEALLPGGGERGQVGRLGKAEVAFGCNAQTDGIENRLGRRRFQAA
jgi:hypothetical protein